MYQCEEEERTLKHYWYTSWPDQKTPDKAPPLLELVQEVEGAREEAPPSSGPTIVHCRSRTYKSLFVVNDVLKCAKTEFLKLKGEKTQAKRRVTIAKR